MTFLATATSLKRVPAAVDIEYRIDGSQVLRSSLFLLLHAHRIEEYLETWARKIPERLFLAEQLEPGRRQVNYRDPLMAVRTVTGNFLFGIY